MDKSSFFTALSTFCKEQVESESEPPKNCPEYKIVWSSIFNVAVNDAIHLPIFFPLVKQYSLSVTEFLNFSCPEIEKSINDSSNEALDIGSRLQSLIPTINLISILPLEKSIKTFNLIIDLFNLLMTQNTELPIEFIKILDSAETSTLTEEILECYFDIVKSYLETEKCSASIVAFSFFASSMIEALPDSCSTICDWMILCLKSEERKQKIASLFLVQKVSSALNFNIDVLPKELFGLILPFLISEDAYLQLRAHKAMRKLVSDLVYYNKQSVDAVIGQYGKYQEDKLFLFFDLLQNFLDNNENPQLSVIQQIFDFSMNAITQVKNPFVKAKSIECLSEIASISEAYIEGVLDEAFLASVSLFAHKSCYTEITNFFMMVSQSFKDYKSNIIDEKLPLLVDSIVDEDSGNKKQRLERAESLATILQNRNFPELISKIVKFANDTLESIVGGEIIYICTLILALNKQLDSSTATSFFHNLTNFAKNETNSTRLNAILHTLKKLMKTFSIDAAEFVMDLLNGEVKYFGGFPAYTCQDDKTMIFFFISTYVRKFPTKSADICVKMIDCVPNVGYTMLSSVLDPLEAGISAGIVSKDDLTRLSATITEIFDKLLLNDEEELIACVEILSKIAKADPSTIDAPKIYSNLAQMLESIQEGEEIAPNGPIIRFVLELSMIKDIPQIDNELVLAAVKLLPLSPQSGSITSIMQILVNNILSDEKFKFLTVFALTAIVELLISPNLNDYNLSADFTNEMKNLLKKMVRADRTLERQISKNFQNSRPKQNKFSRLLK